MNQDARIHTGFPFHPKTRKLLRLAGRDAGWSLMCLWLHVAERRPSGRLDGMTDADIEEAACWDTAGNAERFPAGKFITAAVDAGFLKLVGPGYVVHDWRRNNPWAAGAEGRSERASSAARKRWQFKNDATPQLPLNDNNDLMPPACAPHAPGNAERNAPSPSPSPLPKEGSSATSAPVPAPEPEKPPKPAAKTTAVWGAYSAAYQARYKTSPIRNATVNSVLARIVSTVGADVAPLLAKFYVEHGNPFYATRCHPVELFLQDLQKLTTEWATGNGGRNALLADPAARAAQALNERINCAWADVVTSLRLKREAVLSNDPLASTVVEHICGMATLARLPKREVHEKASAFARAFISLASNGTCNVPSASSQVNHG